MRNHYASNASTFIPYRKEYRVCFENLNGQWLSLEACILLQQAEFRFAHYPNGFYKFLAAPEKPHNAYKAGDSWTEELLLSAKEFKSAFKQLGVAYKSKKQYDLACKTPDGPYKDKFYCSYYDRISRLTWYFRNDSVVDDFLDQCQKTAIVSQKSETGKMPEIEIYGNARREFLEPPEGSFLGNARREFLEPPEGSFDSTEITPEITPEITHRSEGASLEETRVEEEGTGGKKAEDSPQPPLPLLIRNAETRQEEARPEERAEESKPKKTASLKSKAGNGLQAGDWDGTQSSGGGAAVSQTKTKPSRDGTKHNAAASFEQQFKLRSQGEYEFWRTGAGQNDWHEPAVQGILSWLKKKWPDKGWDRGDAIAYIAKREHPDKDEYPVLVARMQEIQNQLSAFAKLSTPAVVRDDSHRHRGPKVAPSKVRSYIEQYHATVAAKKTEEA